MDLTRRNEFACFDIETLEQAATGDGGIEAQLSLISLACTNTMTQTTWFRVVSGGEQFGGTGAPLSRQQLGNFTSFFIYTRALS